VTGGPGDRDAFWALLEAAGEAARWDAEGVADDLVCRLRELPVAELVAFDAVLRALLAESRRRDLWAAAHLINGGRSDGAFPAFQGWLLAQGRRVYEAALRDPDSLAEHPPVRDRPAADPRAPVLASGEMLDVAERAYEHATAGTGAPPLDSLRPPGEPDEPLGADDPEELRGRLPRLWALGRG